MNYTIVLTYDHFVVVAVGSDASRMLDLPGAYLVQVPGAPNPNDNLGIHLVAVPLPLVAVPLP